MGTRGASIATAFLLAAMGSTGAEAKSAPHPLPLHDGFYLDAEVPCGEADSASMLQIMGQRFEAGRNLCTILAVTRQGTAFALTDSCQDTSSGKTRRGKLSWVISNDHTFIIGANSDQTKYRYCPIPSLPKSFKDSKETVPDTPPFGE